MPDPKKYDLEYHPETYWEYRDVETMVKSTVKGTMRRFMAEVAETDEDLGSTDPLRYEESLPEDERAFRGSVHPSLMSGEYLQDLRRGEVEIARVHYDSVTGDVVSVRARWTPGRIRYRIVDEYMEDGPIDCSIKSSTDPLTLRQLIDLMDGAGRWDIGLVMGVLKGNLNAGAEADSLLDFVTVDSAYYPQLAEWYAEAVDEWHKNLEVSNEDETENGDAEGEGDRNGCVG